MRKRICFSTIDYTIITINIINMFRYKECTNKKVYRRKAQTIIRYITKSLKATKRK